MTKFTFALAATAILIAFATAKAADAPTPAQSVNDPAPLANALAQPSDYTITLEDHAFAPTNLTVPAGQKVKLIVKNMNDKPAEFESASLNREKVVTPHGDITVFVGPLDAGKYTYFNDFDRTTTGTITAK